MSGRVVKTSLFSFFSVSILVLGQSTSQFSEDHREISIPIFSITLCVCSGGWVGGGSVLLSAIPQRGNFAVWFPILHIDVSVEDISSIPLFFSSTMIDSISTFRNRCPLKYVKHLSSLVNNFIPRNSGIC